MDHIILKCTTSVFDIIYFKKHTTIQILLSKMSVYIIYFGLTSEQVTIFNEVIDFKRMKLYVSRISRNGIESYSNIQSPLNTSQPFKDSIYRCRQKCMILNLCLDTVGMARRRINSISLFTIVISCFRFHEISFFTKSFTSLFYILNGFNGKNDLSARSDGLVLINYYNKPTL